MLGVPAGANGSPRSLGPAERTRSPPIQLPCSSANSAIGKKTAGGWVHMNTPHTFLSLGAHAVPRFTRSGVQPKLCCGTRMPLASPWKMRRQPVLTIYGVEHARWVGLEVALAKARPQANGMRSLERGRVLPSRSMKMTQPSRRWARGRRAEPVSLHFGFLMMA